MLKSQHAQRMASTAGIAWLGVAILEAFASIVFVLRHYTRFPFGDHWIWLARLYQDGLFATLCSQFNEHRYFVPGLFYFADHRFFGSTNTFLTFFLLAVQIAATALLIRPVWQAPRQPLRYFFAGFTVIL